MANNHEYQRALEAVCSSTEAGELLGVSDERANQFARSGRVAAKRIGRDWVFCRAAVLAMAKVVRPVGQPLPAKITIKKYRKKRR